MCGIVGYIGPRQAATVLLPPLRRLEYRGYDSAGIATVNGKILDVRKVVGKIVRLESVLETDPPQGCVGVADLVWPSPTTGSSTTIESYGRTSRERVIDFSPKRIQKSSTWPRV